MRKTILAFGLAALCAAPAMALDVTTTQNTAHLMPYQPFELTFQHTGVYQDPTWDVTIDVEFTSPAGTSIKVGGFFYGSSKPQEPIVPATQPGTRGTSNVTWPCDPADLWKARYAPSELGRWQFAWTFRTVKGEHAEGRGTFQVVKGRVPQKGFLRISKTNPFRFVLDDGSPFYPVGVNVAGGDPLHLGSIMYGLAMEGPFRTDRLFGTLPPGPLFVRGPSMGPQNGDVFFGRLSRAGFNFIRFSPNNANMVKLFAPPDNQNVNSRDHVRWEQAQMIDEMLLLTRKYGMHSMYGFFGYMDVCNGPEFWKQPKQEELEKVKRLITYSVNRWGAYVDIWQFLNEQKAADAWYAQMVPHLKSVDPYHKPITTSWERPDLAGIDVNAPHTYKCEDELQSDSAVAQWAETQKKRGKIVIYGEQGNWVPSDQRAKLAEKGIGGVWDPGSARRMRVRLWSAFFHEIAFVFWETSYARDGHNMNLWIGPEERQYVRALQDFANRMDAGTKMAPVTLDGADRETVRAYGLASERRAAVYLHHVGCAQCAKEGRKPAHPVLEGRFGHDRGEVKDLTVTLDVLKAATGYWYRPIDAMIVKRVEAPLGRQTFVAPPFDVDLALLITDDGPPDIDRDGRPNDLDDDNDNDGVPNAKDAFPLEREETADVDRDLIGDSLDADIDGDGQADDLNRNGIPDNQELDLDGDGVPSTGARVWDAFPRDPKEWRDTDGDGVGDNADPDIDGDGYSNEEEKKAGTDPLDPLSFPAEP
jgi:hypothetical protein